MEYLTKDSFLDQVNKLKEVNPEHWGHTEKRPGQPVAIDRWSYHECAVQVLKRLNPKNILEAGSMGIFLSPQSDSIDLDIPEWNWRLTYTPTILHDLTKIPWTVGDKEYDCFVALRVFHHMENEPEYLKEMHRIANHIILGVTSDSAKRYEQVETPIERFYFPVTDTVVLVY